MGGADRGVVLGGQVLDAIGVRRGPGGRSAVMVAEPHHQSTVFTDAIASVLITSVAGETDGDGHGAGFIP